jgi:hypothetical protein
MSFDVDLASLWLCIGYCLHLFCFGRSEDTCIDLASLWLLYWALFVPVLFWSIGRCLHRSCQLVAFSLTVEFLIVASLLQFDPAHKWIVSLSIEVGLAGQFVSC